MFIKQAEQTLTNLPGKPKKVTYCEVSRCFVVV